MAEAGFKECGVCGAKCPPNAILCACGMDLTFTAVVAPERPSQADPEPEAEPAAVASEAPPAEGDATLLCENGHELQPGDELCLECGAPPVAGDPVEADHWQLGDYRVPLPLPESEEPFVELIVDHAITRDAARLRIYQSDWRPDPALWERLGRVTDPHVVALLATGETPSGQSWEAWEYPRTEPLTRLAEDDWEACALQLCAGISALHEEGILLRDLSLDTVGRRTKEEVVVEVDSEEGDDDEDEDTESAEAEPSPPESQQPALDLVLLDLSQAAVCDLGLTREPIRRSPRYLAPEAAVAAFEFASDWWSVGALLLDLVSPEGEERPDVNDQAMLLNIVTRGIPVSSDLPSLWQHLLKGLLTRDPAKRWSGAEVVRWLDGERGIPVFYEGDSVVSSQNPLELGDAPCHSAEQWALAASYGENWDDARRQFEGGMLGTWLEELPDMSEERVAEVDRLRRDEALTPDERLAVVLVYLNERLPLSYRGELVNPAWLLANSTEALEWLNGPFAQRLQRVDRVEWFTRMKERYDRAEAIAREYAVDLNANSLRAASLIADDLLLMRRWAQRRADFPVGRRRGLTFLAEKPEPLPEELLVLLAANPEQFIPAQVILQEARDQAAMVRMESFDEEVAREALRHSHREIYRDLNQRLNGFVRCGQERLDEWADEFRFERRLDLARVLVLLQVPEDDWKVPEQQDYLRDLFDFFHKRILGGIQQGPLMRLRTTKNSRNVDLIELNGQQLSTSTLLERIFSRENQPTALDPTIFNDEPALDRRIRRLQRAGQDYQRDTGIDSLYLGFPFLLFRPKLGSETAKPRRVPLFLWPLTIKARAGMRGNLKLGYDHDRGESALDQSGAELNPALQALLPQEEVQALQDAAAEALSRSRLDGEGFFQLCKAALPQMKVGEQEICGLPGEAPPMDWGEGYLYPAGAIFLCDFSQQTIAEDIRRLRTTPLQGSALSQAMRITEVEEPEEDTPQVPEADRYLVLQADPSQQRAVIRARGSHGLVIQGPPGTGKSQTIVNILADSMARGEKVLVVCQKHAALEVVARRLSDEGLASRCFMVEDARRSRRDMLNALREQTGAKVWWRLDQYRDGRKDLAKRIEDLEKDLCASADALQHMVEHSGLTYAEIVDELLELKELEKIAAFELREALRSCSMEEVRAQADQVSGVAGLWLRAYYFDSPWLVLASFSPDSGTLDEFGKRFAELRKAEGARNSLLQGGKRILQIDEIDDTRNWLANYGPKLMGLDAQILKDAWEWRHLYEESRTSSEADKLRDELVGYITQSDELRPLARQYDLGLALIGMSAKDYRQLANAGKLVQEGKSWPAWKRFLPHHLLAKSRVGSFVREHSEEGADPDPDALLLQLDWESERRRLVAQLRAVESRLDEVQASASPPTPEQLKARFEELAARLEAADIVAEAGWVCPNRQDYLESLSKQRKTGLEPFLKTTERSISYAKTVEACNEALGRMDHWFSEEWCAEKKKQFREGQSTEAELMSMNDQLDRIADFQRFRVRFTGLGEAEQRLLEMLESYRETLTDVPEAQLGEVVRHTLLHEALLSWKSRAESQDPALLMDHEEFAEKVETLRDVSGRMVEANKDMLRRPWNMADIGIATRWTDILKLTGPNAMRMREVIDKGWDLGLFNLRPIWLMNPETVSRVFPLRENLFDLVIFDEASQMPVEMAIPSLYRSRRAVISGDRKQLPPTRFFHSQGADDEADGDDDYLGESDFLDEEMDEETRQRLTKKANRREIKDCQDLLQIAGGDMFEVLLTMHYRSRWRHLIEFSNYAFYKGRLSVPVHHPDDLIRSHLPIEVRHVHGVYGNQVNSDEAEEIVDFLAEHWKQENPPSIGIVTFNAKQAELIEDSLEARMEVSEEFRRDYGREMQRPALEQVFVRNLENVQGDERDFIVFSTTFGPDKNGRFIRNFGPLIQRGGERRLNVAITRSREKMLIFTSMPIAEIASAHAGAGGNPREVLKSYLSYCEAISCGDFAQAAAIQEQILGSQGFERDRSLFEKPREERIFVQQVKACLEANGFHPILDTSRDAFHFDMALVDPETGQYGLAIECDPPLHEDLDSARAREIWRPAVMQGTIPRTHRIWSRSWWENPEAEKARLLAAAEGLR